MFAVDKERLIAFENDFDPANPAASRIRILGYGKFSTVFSIEGMEEVALKRLPPFPTAEACGHHERALRAYHMLLRDTVGLSLVPQQCIPLTNADGEHLLYIAQERQPVENIGDVVLEECSDDEAAAVFDAVLRNVLRVWYRNEIEKELDVPGSLMGLDAELANWAVRLEEGRVTDIRYLDTTTPLFRRLGRDLVAPEFMLESVPGPLAKFVRQDFIGDVLERYYDLRLVLIDLVADLYAQDQEDRIPLALDVVNGFLEYDAADLYIEPITREEIDRYARREARFWKRYLALSRFKRFVTTRALRQKYNFVLPE